MQLRPPERDSGFTLIELTVVATIFVAVLVIVGNFLISANNAVAAGTARTADDGAANTALTLLQANIRFASDLSTSPNGSILYVGSGQPCTTTTWTFNATSQTLTEQVGAGGAAIIAKGVSTSGLFFAGSGATGAYQGLVTVNFNVVLPGNTHRDKGGAAVLETLAAQNMTGPVANTAASVC